MIFFLKELLSNFVSEGSDFGGHAEMLRQMVTLAERNLHTLPDPPVCVFVATTVPRRSGSLHVIMAAAFIRRLSLRS